MKRRRAYAMTAGALGLALAFLGCQVIAGLDERSAGPSPVAAIDSGAGGGGGSAGGTDAGAGTSGGGGKGGSSGAAGKGGGAGSGGVAGYGGGGAGGMSCALPPGDPDAGSVPPPPVDDGGKATGAPMVSFAAHDFHFGAVDLASKTFNPNAWRQIGYDLDGLCSHNPDGGAPPGSCQPVQPVPDQLDDGDLCRDNNFGKFIASLGLSAGATFETNINGRVQGGETTIALEIDDLDPGPCDDHAPGRLVVLAPAGGINGIDGGPSPAWLGSDDRVVDQRSLTPDGGIKSARVSFPHGFVRDDVWVSGPIAGSATELLLPLGAYIIDIQADVLVVTAKLTPDHLGIEASTLATVVAPGPVVASLQAAAELALNCFDPPLVNATIAQVITYCDMSSAPSLQDPTKPCDRLSLALGVEWRRIQPLSSSVVVPLLSDPCDAGAAGSGGSGGGGKGGNGGASAGGAAGAAGKGGA